jgi:hypothetical protein
MQEIYIDGVIRLTVTNGIVRVDLGSQIGPGDTGFTPEAAKAAADAKAIPVVPRVRLVMSIEGLGNLHGALEQIAQQMVKDGVLRRNDAATGDTARIAGNSSPNFPKS